MINSVFYSYLQVKTVTKCQNQLLNTPSLSLMFSCHIKNYGYVGTWEAAKALKEFFELRYPP